ncbi:serine/threonine-protein kinase Nek11-like [Polypterus senegalus]|uniref:serine/threonine-protein kinase Nek11-like n=1 Tax=Polypterus senegalus TaxID=55291 RepID=UPI00196356FD|nr:serine/threonine-protein kinase Nek11-like [Polypterus senegalus]
MESDLLFIPGACVAGRYIVQTKLGSGSFATVYLVQDSKSKCNENKKVLKRILLGDLRGDETVSFAKEAQLLSSLQHPAIVHFYSSFAELDSFCIVTEYCEGGDLHNKLCQRQAIKKLYSEKQVVEWLIQILLGVQYLHDRLILHRDLKTKNIFLKEKMIKIGDFGVSRILAGSTDFAKTFTGTPFYMSPEIFTCGEYDSKSDIWSLGCILYEMATLTQAFNAHSWVKLVHKIVEEPAPVLPGCFSRELNDILQSMLSKDPANRPAASETLRFPFIDQYVKNLTSVLQDLLETEEASTISEESAHIAEVVKKKVHLESLWVAAKVQGLDPRERRRLRQDEQPELDKMRKAVSDLYQQNKKKGLKLRNKTKLVISQPSDQVDFGSLKIHDEILDLESDETETDSDSDEMEETMMASISEYSEEQNSTLRAYQSYLLNILETSTKGQDPHISSYTSGDIPTETIQSKIDQLKQICIDELGNAVFQQIYCYLRSADQIHSGNEHKENHTPVPPQAWDQNSKYYVMIQQLLFLEEKMKHN